ADDVIDHKEIKAEEEHGHDHHRSRCPHLFARRRSDLAHFRAHIVVKRPNAFGEGLDLTAKAVVTGCGYCVCHLLRPYSHHYTWPSAAQSQSDQLLQPWSLVTDHCPPFLAGAEGFEPPSPVLETGSLTVELTPLNSSGHFSVG